MSLLAEETVADAVEAAAATDHGCPLRSPLVKQMFAAGGEISPCRSIFSMAESSSGLIEPCGFRTGKSGAIGKQRKEKTAEEEQAWASCPQ